MGEAFGRWQLGPDEELMKYIDVANVACGFHASDPVTLHKSECQLGASRSHRTLRRQNADRALSSTAVKLAKKYNVAVGAHPGFPDLAGFGESIS